MTTDSTRSRIREVMARAYVPASLTAPEAFRVPEAYVDTVWPRLLKSMEAVLAALSAEGMTVVPVGGTARSAALEEAATMAETFAESHRAPPHHNDTFWAAMNIAKAIRTLGKEESK